MTEMHADYDSTANAVSLTLEPVVSAERADQVHPRAIVALHNGQPVEVQLLYPEHGIDEPLRMIARRYSLDAGALVAAAHAAVSAPDRAVALDIAASATA
jgi:hypothetical protein